MKIQLTMKTPDVLYDAVERAAQEYVQQYRVSLFGEDEPSPFQIKQAVEFKIEEYLKKCARWFKYNECLTIQIDLDYDKIEVL